jgi:hypothetical protein
MAPFGETRASSVVYIAYEVTFSGEIEGDGNGTVLSEVINISNDAENSR